ncbi:extracellular solute-binding protein [Nonomuraea sp. NPDC052129]|uniref:extracellular solute-binding protein n=1 Tax=Nonomuraea sp. NPDC052129 TaxID=3154651 RepID=UPI0034136AA1
MSAIPRRDLLRGAALLTLGGAASQLTLTGCGSSEPQAGSSKTGPQGQVVVWMHEEPANTKYFNAKIAEYQKQFPKVSIKPLYVPIANLDTKLSTAFTTGAPPDLIKVGAWTLAERASKQQLAPLPPAEFGAASIDALKGKFETNAFAALTYEEQVYGTPIDFNSVHLWYRRDRFEKAGLDPDKPPTTWEEVAEFSKKLTNADASQVGLQWQLADNIWAMLNFIPLIRGLGGQIIDESSRRGMLNTPEGIKALEYYGSLGNPKLSDPVGAFGLFAKGTSAMLMSGRFTSSLIPAINPNAKLGQTFDSALVPSWEGKEKVAAGYSWGWFVAKKAKNPYTAWHFINWLLNGDNVNQQLAATGLVTPTAGWQKLPAAGDKASQQLEQQIPYTDFGPVLPQWTETIKALLDALESVIHKQAPAQQAATAFDAAVGRILK